MNNFFLNALYTLYPQIVKTDGNDAFDAAGNPVAYDEAVVQAYMTANAYKTLRQYPPIGDQLDALWKGGAAEAAMRDMVLAVKAKYPKP